MTAIFQVRVLLPDKSCFLRIDSQRLALPITDVLGSHGVPLNTRCGGQGVCDGCEVELIAGAAMDIETRRQVRAGATPVRIRACRSRLLPEEEVAIRILARSLAAHEPLATTDFRIRVPFSHQPLFDGELAAAIDVGTTSVSVALVNLADGAMLAVRSAPNAQARWGQDVLSRISHCQRDRKAVSALQQAIVRTTIRPLLDQCLGECGASPNQLGGVTVAGNTVMLHLLAGEDPTSLGQAPFDPVFLDHRELSAKMLGLADPDSAEDVPVHLLPSASAYVGADIVGGAVATGLAYRPKPSILLDLGTNGEIIARHRGRRLACATAAGPAFEGTGLTCGMIASSGAISRVRLAAGDTPIELDVIGNQRPRGICGSGYIDLLAEGRRTGLINRHGRLRFDDAPEFRPLRECVDGVTALRIAVDAAQRPIVVTEADLAALLQAKAAIAAGALTLLERCRIDAGDIGEAFVAGAFGTHLDPNHAVDIGLLPAGLRGRIAAAGNTSLASAYMAALDRRILEDLETFARDLEVVELNFDEHFESCFVDQLLLP